MDAHKGKAHSFRWIRPGNLPCHIRQAFLRNGQEHCWGSESLLHIHLASHSIEADLHQRLSELLRLFIAVLHGR